MHLFALLVLQSARTFRRNFISLMFSVLGPLLLAAYYMFVAFGGSEDPPWLMDVALVDSATMPESVRHALDDTASLDFQRLTREEAYEALQDGTVVAVFEYFGAEADTPGLRVEATPALFGVMSDLAATLRPAVRAGRAEYDVVVRKTARTRDFRRAIQWIAPGLVIFSIINLGFLTAGTNVTMARQDSSLLLYEISPIGAGRYVAAELVIMALVGLLQAVLFFSLFAAFSDFTISGSPLAVAAVVLLSAATFSAIGMFVAGILPRAQIGFAVTPFLNILVFGFGNVLWAAADVEALRPLVFALPSTYAVDALRQVVDGSDGLFPLWADVAILFATTGLALWGAAKWFRFGPGGR